MAVVNWSLQAYTDTAANLNARATPILEGQLAIETDTITTTPKFKIGDGVSLYSALPYFYGGASSAQNLNNVLGVGRTTGGNNMTLTTGDKIFIGSDETRHIEFDNSGIELHNFDSSAIVSVTDSGYWKVNAIQYMPLLTASRLLSLDANKEMVVETGTGFLKLNSGVISYDNSSYQPLDSDLTSWAGVTRASGFDTFVATPSSANLLNLVTDETGSGALVFGTQPTFTQWITVPRIYGGTGVNDGIDFYSTSGNGTSGSVAHRFLGGNNGATTILTMLNDGTIRIPNNRVIQGTDSAGTNRSLLVWSSGDNITITGRPGVTDINLNPTSGGIGLYVKSGGDGGIGTASPSARWHIIKTSEQLRVGYDTSNYYSTTVGSTGTVTFNAVGAGSKFVFSDNIELTQTVTTEVVVSDTTVTIVINGTTYKLLAKA